MLLQKRKGARLTMSTADAIKAVYAFKHPQNELNDAEKVKSLSDSKRIYRDGETQSAKPRALTKEEIHHGEKMRQLEEVNNRPPTRNELINTNYYLNDEEERKAKEEEAQKKRREEEAAAREKKLAEDERRRKERDEDEEKVSINYLNVLD